MTASTQSRASIAILASALMWGTWWIPLRQLDQAGVSSSWANAAPMFLPLVILLPFVVTRWRRIATGGWQVYAAGFLIAAVVALYAEGLLRGHVARVILLFYLTPVWSAIGGRIFLGIPITRRRMLTIVLGLTGMAIVFGADAGLPMPTNIAEWMALISGILWAGGLVILHRIESVPLFDKTFVQFLFLGIIYLGLSSIPGGGSWTVPVFDNIGPSIFWIAALALIWVLPVMFLSMYAAGKIDPAKVSILLTLEVVIGITSASLLTEEPFGLREFVGAALIIAAGLMEFSSAPGTAPKV